jgi:hypothetical protein
MTRFGSVPPVASDQSGGAGRPLIAVRPSPVEQSEVRPDRAALAAVAVGEVTPIKGKAIGRLTDNGRKPIPTDAGIRT